MKKIIASILALCLLLSLAACGSQSAEPAGAALPDEPGESVPEPSPSDGAETEDAALPEKLELSVGVPSAEGSPFGLQYYVNRSPELGCAFAYPDFCTAETGEGVVKLNPRSFFARIFLYAYPKGADGSPASPAELLEPQKWSAEPQDCTVGGRYDGLIMSNNKYDTYRRWIVWETDDMIFQLYAACFDNYEDTINNILDVAARSFCPAGELALPVSGGRELLRSRDGVELYLSGAEVGVEGGTLELWLMLELENGSGRDVEFVTDELYADGERLPGMGRCAVPAGESAVWPVSLPVTADGEAIGELSLVIAAFDGEGQIDELRLPVELSFTRPEG